MLLNMSFPFWPMRPVFGFEGVVSLLALVGVVCTVIMLIDCLKREPKQFSNPISPEGKYDKIIWALAMALSLSLYFLGTIVYFFVVYRSKDESQSQ